MNLYCIYIYIYIGIGLLPFCIMVEATLIVTFAFVYFAEKMTSTNLKTRNLPQENNGSALSFKIGFQQRFSKHYSSFHGL